MTDTISDEAYALAADLHNSGDATIERTEMLLLIIEQALTAARVKGREEAAKCVEDFDHPECEGGSRFADAIRALKVEGK